MNTFPALGTKTVTWKVPTVLFDGRFATTFEIREPTGRDIDICGYPIVHREDGGLEFDAPKMSKMITRLGNLSPLSVENACMSDWLTAATTVASFLGRAAQESSTDVLTPPISGGLPPTST